MTDSCFVCIEKYNKTTRKQVTCAYCDYNACSNCCKSYLLTINSPKCMNCNTLWSREYLQKTLTKTFVETQLKNHHKEYLFDLEKALIPATMPEIKKFKEKINILNTIEQIQKEISNLETERNIKIREHNKSNIIKKLYNENENRTTLKTKLFKDANEIENINNEIRNRALEIIRLKNQLNDLNNYNPNVVEKTRNNIQVIRCPQTNCRAFLDENYKCDLCNIHVCSECHQIKKENHICNLDDISTVKLIKTQTKPCPNCAVSIYKIDGCDQMWCTSCHTAFSWATGNIETKIHNPHYFQWLRKNKNQNVQERNPLDFACGRDFNAAFLRDFNKIRERITTVYNSKNYAFSINIFYENIYNFILRILDLLHNIIPQYQQNIQINNKELRIKYILQEISEEEFKKLIFSKEKFSHRNKEIVDLLVMYIHVSTDIIYKIYKNAYTIAYKNGEFDISNKIELKELTEYFTNNLERICSVYVTKPPKNILDNIQKIEKLVI